jgi:hypothetical protein
VNFESKEVYVLTTQADPDCKDADKREDFYREAIEARKGKFIKLFALYGASPGATASREEIVKRVDSALDKKAL